MGFAEVGLHVGDMFEDLRGENGLDAGVFERDSAGARVDREDGRVAGINVGE
jgi:hypothetical protein